MDFVCSANGPFKFDSIPQVQCTQVYNMCWGRIITRTKGGSHERMALFKVSLLKIGSTHEKSLRKLDHSAKVLNLNDLEQNTVLDFFCGCSWRKGASNCISHQVLGKSKLSRLTSADLWIFQLKLILCGDDLRDIGYYQLFSLMKSETWT